MSRHLQITLFIYTLCLICMSIFGSAHVLAQRSDSAYFTPSKKRVSNTPQIKTNIKSYRPSFGFIPYNSFSTGLAQAVPAKSTKILTVLKVYPNPIDDQINISLRLERESMISIRIMDLLGNEVMTLANERFSAGDITKSYQLPNRLNSGIYFLRIVAGAETNVKRISVL